MHKFVALTCVIGWSFFCVFGYLAVTGLAAAGAGALISAVLSLYGLAVGCTTWARIRSGAGRPKGSGFIQSRMNN